MMEFGIRIQDRFIGLPIQAECPEKKLEIFLGEEKLYEFMVPESETDNGRYDFYSYLNVKKYEGKTLTFKGDFRPQFFKDISQTETDRQEPLVRPLLHFTAERGWINDPNGFVFHNGEYHLYFQYNPMNTQWQNMTWGHSVSRDLLHFTQKENALYPDEHGTAFSGCGLVNEQGLMGLPKDALLFYYTAAGSTNDWSKGKQFTQRLAYSLDQGQTMTKMPGAIVDVIQTDSRDPKIFWHEKSGAYVMVLWIQGFEFGILRSNNLKDWKMTDRFTLDQAWECPDLFALDLEGEEQWVFMSADGFYYFGEFDGYHFTTDGVQRRAYQNKLPYAAQSCSGLTDRVVCIPWLRTQNKGKLYTGMMGIPREMGIVKKDGEKLLTLVPVREYESRKEELTEFCWGEQPFEREIEKECAIELELHPSGNERIEITVFDQKLVIEPGAVLYKEEKTELPRELKEIHIIIDRQVIELYANEGTVNLYYETESDLLKGKLEVKGGSGAGKVYTCL